MFLLKECVTNVFTLFVLEDHIVYRLAFILISKFPFRYDPNLDINIEIEILSMKLLF